MFQVKPEESEAFYDISLYPDVDYVIISSAVRHRYERNRNLFRRQMAFYDHLESHFKKIKIFKPSSSLSPNINIYKNPIHGVSFCRRKNVAWPSELNPSLKAALGSKEIFYLALGLNYESCKRYEEAIAYYELALNNPIYSPKNFYRLVRGMTRSLVQLGDRNSAAAFLERAAEAATHLDMAENLRVMRRNILQGDH